VCEQDEGRKLEKHALPADDGLWTSARTADVLNAVDQRSDYDEDDEPPGSQEAEEAGAT